MRRTGGDVRWPAEPTRADDARDAAPAVVGRRRTATWRRPAQRDTRAAEPVPRDTTAAGTGPVRQDVARGAAPAATDGPAGGTSGTDGADPSLPAGAGRAGPGDGPTTAGSVNGAAPGGSSVNGSTVKGSTVRGGSVNGVPAADGGAPNAPAPARPAPDRTDPAPSPDRPGDAVPAERSAGVESPGVRSPDSAARHRRTPARQAARAALVEARRPAKARRATGRLSAAIAFVVVAVLTVAAHLLTAALVAPRAASVGEARMAVAALAVRGSAVAAGVLTLPDRFAALQIAVVQLVLPHGDPADTARWACLALGAATALLLWPTLRRLSLSTPSTAAAVMLLGAALPILTVQAGITAAAPAALWLTLAGALGARDRGRTALGVALVAVATAPLAAVPLLGLAAHVVLNRTVQVPAPKLVGGLAAVAAVVVGALSVAPGAPLAGTGGPAVGTALAATGTGVALALVVAAAASERWVRPVMTGAGLLVLAALVPGPSRVAAFLLAAPLVATAVAVVVERAARPVRLLALGLTAALVAVPAAVVVAGRNPVPPREVLAVWIATQAAPDAVVVADPLDRVALLDAGVAASRLRDPADAVEPGELRLVSMRPEGTQQPCTAGLALAGTARGTGDAPGQVCATAEPAEGAAARARFGGALAANPAFVMAPPAAATLKAGDVDTRLMLTLAALSSAHRVGVADFPTAPLDVAGPPRRRMVVETFDGAPAASSELLRTWLSAQQAPFTPGTITAGSGGSLLIGYPAPAPAGLLPS